MSRIHSMDFAPNEFNPTVHPSPSSAAGRFDCLPGDPHASLYAAENDDAAAAETLLRRVPEVVSGRYLPLAVLAQRCLSHVELARPLRMVQLHAHGLGQLGLSSDLITKCDAKDFVVSREWARAIRTWSADTHGLTWRSRRNNAFLCHVFFGDRCRRADFTVVPHTLATDGPSLRLDTPIGQTYMRTVLQRYGIAVRYP